MAETITGKTPERTIISPDFYVRSKFEYPVVLKPGGTLSVENLESTSYFDNQPYNPYLRQLSIRSVLAQAGVGIIQHDPNKDEFILRNQGPAKLIIPENFRLGRYFLQGEIIKDEELKQILDILSQGNSEIEIDDDQATLILPINRHALITQKEIDIDTLESNRKQLDAHLGIDWNSISGIEPDTLVIGETPSIIIPQKTIGVILVGAEDDTVHAQSPLIDPGFGKEEGGLPIRTEFWHLSARDKPMSFVRMQLFRA